MNSVPKIGLALGGGGARGLAHIEIIKVLDEFDIKPKAISGTSMGAIVGSLYAAGMSGEEMEEYARQLFSNRTELLKKVYGKWPSVWSSLFNFSTPAILNAETFFEMLMPEELPETFEELDIAFCAIATDFYTQEQVILNKGAIMPAVAASCALPALLTPVKIGDQILIDGGFVSPVPFTVFDDSITYTIAVDVTGESARLGEDIPNSADALIGASQIMLRALTKAQLKNQQPDCYIQPKVGKYQVHDYLKVENILENSLEAADDLRRALDQMLTYEILEGVEVIEQEQIIERPAKPKKRWLRLLTG